MSTRQLASLVLFKAYAELRSEASRYFLSILWWVFDPVLSLLVYYVMFGVLLQRGGPEFAFFLLIGIVVWQWFERSALHGMSAIYSNGALMNLVRIPKVYFPAVTTAVDSVKFLIVFALLLLFLWLSGYAPNAAYLALPAVIGVELLLIWGMALLLAGLMPLLPDMKYLVEVLFRLGFFASGILFPASRIPETYRDLYQLNPMVNLIEAYRGILMSGAWPDWGRLAAIAAVALLLWVLAHRLVRRLEQDYPRLLSR
jgi:lipopolysaccharide transport system permease protein